MAPVDRRKLLLGGSAVALAAAGAPGVLAQSGHEHHGGLYESSTGARSSSWAARATSASTARTRPTTPPPTAGRPTPRHGLGAALVADAIHVAGGGPIMGGAVQSAVHEAFTLG